MTTYSSVYYPHTTIQSEELLRQSLLLWDRVDVIVPEAGFSVTTGLPPIQAAACELLVRPRVPSAEEKQSVDVVVQGLLTDGVPSWLVESLTVDSGDGNRPSPSQRHPDYYLVYPEKLLHNTWARLRGHGVARWFGEFGDYGVPPALGLLLMSCLADACAGRTLHKITDRPEAYRNLFGLMSSALGGTVVRMPSTCGVSDAIDRLVTVSTRVANVRNTPMSRLVDLRRKEEKEKSGHLRSLRHKYLDEVTAHAKALLEPGLTLGDKRELENEYKQRVERDLVELKRSLGMARNDVLLSKEAATTAVAAAAAVTGPVGAAVSAALKGVSVGALLATGVKYARARRHALSSHSVSWLFLARRRTRDLLLCRR